MNSDHMDHASTLIRKLKTFQSISEPDIAFEAFLLELEYLRKSGNSPKSLELINDRVDQFNNSSSTCLYPFLIILYDLLELTLS